jgi:hypothetical protein
MASIYPKSGTYYAPEWTHPLTGAVVGAHSLRTKDPGEAERRWEIEKAQAILTAQGGVAQSAAQRAFNPMVAGSTPAAPTARVRFTAAAAEYLRHLKGGVKPATLKAYEGYVRHIVARLGDPFIDELTTERLHVYCEAEVAHLGRTHTVVKRLESIIKPALRHAIDRGQLPREPLWPRLRSDYRAKGQGEHALTREQYAALRLELPPEDILQRGDGRKLIVYPRRYLDLAVDTGLHDADLNRLCGAQWDPVRRLWLRVNSKNDAHYEPEWLPADPLMIEHLKGARTGDDRLFVAELATSEVHELPAQWMRRRLIWAAHRTGLCRASMTGKGSKRQLVVAAGGWYPSANDLRRTFATWRRADGWTFDETARWLANSSGMVREVYAKMAPKAMARAVARSGANTSKLLKLTRDLEAARRGPRSAGSAVVKTVVTSPNTQELTHGKLSR